MKTKPNEFVENLRKREYFAAMAMQALLSTYKAPYIFYINDTITQVAVMYADNLINDLNKQDDENNKTKL